jgi:geranylgeranyl reductase family protein
MAKTAVVIGSGPGGGAAAVRLKQRGVDRVILIDKEQFPRDKTCGSGLSPNALQVIESLGIAPEVHRLGYPIHSVVFGTPGGRRMKLTTDAAAVVLLRKYFDNLLVEKAKSLGAEFHGGVYINELIRDGSGRVVGCRGRNGEEFRGDFVLMADGAHSIFSHDPRPRRTVHTLMGWWEDFDYEPHTMEMFFDKSVSPLYGWMFPEAPRRVNIGICIDGEDADGKKTQRNVRDVFNTFLHDNYRHRLENARQVGKFRGHPISYCTWIRDLDDNGAVYLGEGGRMVHNATGEGISYAMQSGIWCADAVADIFAGASEKSRLQKYTWQCRKHFTGSFVMGHVLRGAMKTPVFDWIADAYNHPQIRGVVTSLLATALTSSGARDKSGKAGDIERVFEDTQRKAGGYTPITERDAATAHLMPNG